MSMTHTPAHSTHHPDRFEDETTGLGYDVYQDTDAEDPRSWIGDDEAVAVYVFNGPRGDKDAEVPDNVAAQAFARFYEIYEEDIALAVTRRWLTIFREEKYDLAMGTIRGYSQSDWADVFAASIIDHEDGTPGYGTAQGHIDQYASWRWGDVWTVSPDEGDSLSGIYADNAEEALKLYLEDNPPATADEAPQEEEKEEQSDDDRMSEMELACSQIIETLGESGLEMADDDVFDLLKTVYDLGRKHRNDENDENDESGA